MENKGICFNRIRIKDLKSALIKYHREWDSEKNAIPDELHEILDEIISRLIEDGK